MTMFPGVGLLVLIIGTRDSDGITIGIGLHILGRAPGELVTASTTRNSGFVGVVVTVQVSVNCVAEFTGLDCTTPVTTSATTHTEITHSGEIATEDTLTTEGSESMGTSASMGTTESQASRSK